MTENVKEWPIRMLNISVYPPEKEDWKTIRELFAEYRCALRKAAMMHGMTEIAGAEIKTNKRGETTLKPSKTAGEIRTALFGSDKKKRELYPWLKENLPSFSGTTHDCAMSQINDAWKSHDPSIPKATYGYLLMQGERGYKRMSHADIPVRAKQLVAEGHSISLKVFAERGKTMDLKLGTVDPMAWRRWQALLAHPERMGDPVRLNLRDGKNPLRLCIPYREEPKQSVLQECRSIEVAFGETPERAMVLTLREGHETIIDEKRNYKIDATGAIAQLIRHNTRKARLEKERAACGRRGNQGIGNDKAYRATTRRLDRLSKAIAGTKANWNHTFTARIVKQAERWKCATIVVVGPPEDLCGESWPWADFRAKLQYKAGAIGAECEYTERVDTEAITA